MWDPPKGLLVETEEHISKRVWLAVCTSTRLSVLSYCGTPDPGFSPLTNPGSYLLTVFVKGENSPGLNQSKEPYAETVTRRNARF